MTNHPSWWDPYSDQPYKLPEDLKPRLTATNLAEYLKTGLTALLLSPVVALRYAHPTGVSTAPPDMTDFVGLSVSPDSKWNDAIVDMVHDLGVRHLLMRVPAWDLTAIDRVQDMARRLPDRDLLVNILQHRESVTNPSSWEVAVQTVFKELAPVCRHFQVGNAVNRSKWGCRHSGDALQLFKIADRARAGFPDIELLGSSIIDFEPLVQLRTLFNFSGYEMDGCASQLYVNRRGSAYGKQYRHFDLARKIRLNHALLSLSNNTSPRLWITETNWPLLDTKPYTPNSGHPRSTVDEATQATYLEQYFTIARASGMVERVYWWQLINPGYGLVDHRTGSLRKMPSYDALKSLLKA